jgi:hypothetical protein
MDNFKDLEDKKKKNGQPPKSNSFNDAFDQAVGTQTLTPPKANGKATTISKNDFNAAFDQALKKKEGATPETTGEDSSTGTESTSPSTSQSSPLNYQRQIPKTEPLSANTRNTETPYQPLKPALDQIADLAKKQQQEDDLFSFPNSLPGVVQQPGMQQPVIQKSVVNDVMAGNPDAITKVINRQQDDLKKQIADIDAKYKPTGDITSSYDQFPQHQAELDDIRQKQKELIKTGVDALDKTYADKFTTAQDQSPAIQSAMGAELRKQKAKIGADPTYADQELIVTKPNSPQFEKKQPINLGILLPQMQTAGETQKDRIAILAKKANQVIDKSGVQVEKVKQNYDFTNRANILNAAADQKRQQVDDLMADPKVQQYLDATDEEKQKLQNDPTVQQAIQFHKELSDLNQQRVDLINQYPEVKAEQKSQQVASGFADYIRRARKGEFGSAEQALSQRGLLEGTKLNDDYEIKRVAELSDGELTEDDVRKYADQANIPSYLGLTLRGFGDVVKETEQGLNRLTLPKRDADIQNAMIEDAKYHTPEALQLSTKNINPDTILSTMFSTTGQIAAYGLEGYLGGELIGAGTGLTRAASLAKEDLATINWAEQTMPSNKLADLMVKMGAADNEVDALGQIINATSRAKNISGTFSSMYATSYENAYQQASKLTDDESKRNKYASEMATANGLAMTILNPANLASKAVSGLSREQAVMNFIKSDVPISSTSVLKDRLAEIAKTTGLGATQALIPVIAETMAKSDIFNYHTSSSEFFNQALNASMNMAIGILPLGVLGASKTPSSDYVKSSLFQAGDQPELVKSTIRDAFTKGEINDVEKNRQISVVNTLTDLVNRVPDKNNEGKVLSQPEKNELVYRQLQNAALDKKAEGALKGHYEKEIKENDKVVNDIMGAKEILPLPTTDDEWKQRVAAATTETEKDAVMKQHADFLSAQIKNEKTPEQVIIDEAGKGTLANGYGDLVKQNPEAAKDVLLDYAKQKYAISDNGTELEGGGREITNPDIDKAVTKAFPNKESVIEEIYKPKIQTNGNKEEGGKEASQKSNEEISKESEGLRQGQNVKEKTGAAETTNTETAPLPDFSKDKDAFNNRFLNDFNIVENSAFDWRVKSALSASGRIKAVEDIKEGKNTAIARTLQNEMQEHFDKGTITINRGRGNNAETVEIPIKDWFALEPKEQNAAIQLDDHTASIINENDITLKNIGLLKHLFDGFPYTEKDFEAVKDYLTRKDEGDGKNQPISESGQPTKTAQSPASERLVNETKNTEVSDETKVETADEGKTTEAILPAENTAGGEKPPISEPPKGTTIHFERPATELSHRGLQDIANEFSLPDVETRDRKTDVQLRQDAQNTANDWIEKGQYGKKVEGLVQKAENGEVLTDEQRVILEQHLANLIKELRDINDKNSPEFDTKLSEIKRLKDAGERTRSEAGAALRIPMGGSRPKDLADFMVEEMDAAGVDTLTEVQKEKASKEYEDLKAANEAYQQKVAGLEAENARLQADKEVKKSKPGTKTKKTKEDFVTERKSLKDELASARKEHQDYLKEQGIQTMGIGGFTVKEAKIIGKYVRSYAEEGLSKLSDIVDKVIDEVKDLFPGIDQKDVHDIIAGVYNEKKQTKSEIASTLRDLRDESKLINKLSTLENGEEPKSERRKVERNQEITDLRNKIKAFQARTKSDTKEITAAAPAKDKTQGRLESYKKKAEKDIKLLEYKLKTGDFDSEGKPKRTLKLDKEATDLRDKLVKLQQERDLRLIKERYANRSKYEKARDATLEVLNVPRTIMSSVDLSATLRQGLVATISHPVMGAKALGESVLQAFSQKRFDRWFYDLKQDPRYEVMKKSGLPITDPHDYRLSAKEEQFMNNLAEKIPVLGKFIKGSERAYVLYLNKMRVDLFNRYADSFAGEGYTPGNSPKIYEKLASFIGNSTGRGNLPGKLENFAPVLNTMFFSPRLIASRINLLNPVYYAKLPQPVRMIALKSMAKFIGVGLTTLALAKLNGAEVEDDPRSSDFGKIKVGNTRWDIWGGFQQYIRVLTQFFSGERKSTNTGDIQELNGKGFFGEDRGDVVSSFFRGKLAPVPSMAWDFIKGRDATGQPVTIGSEAKGHLLPLLESDIEGAVKDQGIKAIFTAGVPSIFGIGVNTYQPRQ